MQLPLRVHDFLAGVPLHDVWALDLPPARPGITLDEFLRAADAQLCAPSPIVRALLNVRFLVGRMFGWDSVPAKGTLQTFSDRLTDADRASSLAPAGASDGPDCLFRVVYRFENERLDEVINRTVHAAALRALVETSSATASTSPSTSARSGGSHRSTWHSSTRSAGRSFTRRCCAAFAPTGTGRSARSPEVSVARASG